MLKFSLIQQRLQNFTGSGDRQSTELGQLRFAELFMAPHQVNKHGLIVFAYVKIVQSNRLHFLSLLPQQTRLLNSVYYLL
jgi:hypothetical protein